MPQVPSGTRCAQQQHPDFTEPGKECEKHVPAPKTTKHPMEKGKSATGHRQGAGREDGDFPAQAPRNTLCDLQWRKGVRSWRAGPGSVTW